MKPSLIATLTSRSIVLLFIAGLFNSCCTKKDCTNSFEDLRIILMDNFSAIEVDSIAIESFKSNTNYTQKIDSFFSQATGPVGLSPGLAISLNEPININLEYKLTLLSTGQVYMLTGFISKKEKCNSCFLGKDQYVNRLYKYKVNGVEIERDQLEILK